MDARIESYKETSVKDIKIEDYKISIIGTVIKREGNSFILDDGAGQILVISNDAPNADYVRVFGRVVPYENGFELEADIIQDLSKVDRELLRKVRDLFK